MCDKVIITWNSTPTIMIIKIFRMIQFQLTIIRIYAFICEQSTKQKTYFGITEEQLSANRKRVYYFI